MLQNKVKFWYDEVVSDLGKIVDAIDYYKLLYQDGQPYLSLKGRLNSLFDEQAGIVKYYESGYTDAAMIHKWLEEYIKYKKAQKKKYYMSAIGKAEISIEYGDDLKKTDIDILINSDTDIYELTQILLIIELWRNNLSGLVEGLKKRGIYLSMSAKARLGGVEEAYIDATKESDPETL